LEISISQDLNNLIEPWSLGRLIQEVSSINSNEEMQNTRNEYRNFRRKATDIVTYAKLYLHFKKKQNEIIAKLTDFA